jgi:class 3 adenylate cyclase
MPELPTGTVTFLFTDLEGSTRLWEDHPEAMKAALARHDEILRDAVEKRGGHVVKTTGDGLHAAFAVAADAVTAATDAQRALLAEEWVLPEPLRVRMGLHTGGAEIRDGDYYGPAVNRAARVSAAAHGGQVVVSHATEELIRDDLPAGAALTDLGEHRLRDLARPERVYQVDAPGLPDAFPPLRSIDAFPSNLPLQLSSFVGREREIANIAKELHDARLVTLTGVGGVGKTRLSIQVAAEVLPHYPDGVWLCELAAATDPDTLIQVVASTLGVAQRPGLDLAASILEYLRGRELLVVLDNCEHLLDAAGRLSEGILRECANVRILATSREGLGVEGERVVALRSLAVPEVGAGSDDVARAMRCACSSSAPTPRRPSSRSTTDPSARWPRSAGASTGSRSPSSSRRPASSRCTRARSPSTSTSGSGCSPGAGVPRSSATTRCAPPSTGRTRCSRRPSRRCSPASGCSPGASTRPRPRRS